MPHGPTFLCVQKRWHFLWWRKAIQGPKAVFPGTPHPNLAFTTHLKKNQGHQEALINCDMILIGMEHDRPTI